MVACPKNKTIALATGNGSTIFLQPKDGNEWHPVGDSVKEIMQKTDYTAMSADILFRGQQINLFVIGYSNGMIRLYSSENPKLVAEIQAHSR